MDADRTADYQLVAGRAAFAEQAAALVASASRELAILSYELEREVYGGEAFLAAVRGFVLQHRHARLRVLINATQKALAEGGRLVEFGRGMASFVQFRALPELHRAIQEEVLIADGRRLLLRGSPLERNARYYDAAPHVARLRQKAFDALWDEAEPAQELRGLRL